jgi:hypothetical protein
MTTPATYKSEVAQALSKQVALAQDRYLRQVKASLWRLQSVADPADGFTPSPVAIRAQAEKTRRSIEHVYLMAHRSGCKFGREHAYLDLERFGIPRPAVELLEYTDSDVFSSKALLEQKLTEAVELLCMCADPNAALGPVKRSAQAAVSTILNTAYTQQQMATYRASASFPSVDSTRQATQIVMLFGFISNIFSWILSIGVAVIRTGIWLVHTAFDLAGGGGDIKYEWHADGVSASGACRLCRKLDGQESDWLGNWQQGSWYGAGPPRHPNCQCRTTIKWTSWIF